MVKNTEYKEPEYKEPEYKEIVMNENGCVSLFFVPYLTVR